MFYQDLSIVLLPLDGRPVCYDLPQQLAAVAGLELLCPPANLLGQLKHPADTEAVHHWLKERIKNTSEKAQPIPVIAALDTIAYGGLISSRVGDEPLSQLQGRIGTFLNSLIGSQVLGFSSILRIPAYNNAEEEPDYWAKYGKALYDYSYACHENPDAAKRLSEKIPPVILQDFLNRRKRNFELNQSYFPPLLLGQLNYLTFCQDDTGAYGLNVQEAQRLDETIVSLEVSERAHIQTGADEVALCFLAKILSDLYRKAGHPSLKIAVRYSDPDSASKLAKFDGLPIQQVVERAIRTCGGEVVIDEQIQPDLTLWVHTPPQDQPQGDHCDVGQIQLNTQVQVDRVILALENAFKKNHPVAIADVAYANGSDALLVGALLDEEERLPDLPGKLYGYAGWNTPGNTIGTTVAMAIVRLLAERNGTFDLEAFKRLLMVRIADDGFYQAYARREVRRKYPPDQYPMGSLPKDATDLLNQTMTDQLNCLQRRLQLPVSDLHVSFPCERTFEIKINAVQADACSI